MSPLAEGIDRYMDDQMRNGYKYGAIYRPTVNYRGGERHDFYARVTFTEFDTREEMELHIRNSVREADSYEYIKYETLKVSVKVEVQ